MLAAADTGVGWRNANLRTQFLKVLGRAKVQSWPRQFHSMRASRRTELGKDFPLHVFCSLLGKSPKVAQRSYLLVTSDDFKKAIQGVEKSGTKGGTVKRKSGTMSGTASASTLSQNLAKTQAKQGSDGVFPGKCEEKQADGEGFEPTVRSLVRRFSKPVP